MINANLTQLKPDHVNKIEYIDKLAKLIANITESYSTVIFLANRNDEQRPFLEISGYHTLSREFVESCKIHWGSGLVGWTAENAARISVCPFEHDASTLLYYSSDQLLKSFIAIPVIDKNQEVVGVIACDSKKSYAFAKITEKILTECAELLVNYLNIKTEQVSPNRPQTTENQILEKKIIARLEKAKSEDELLSQSSILAKSLVECEALVVITSLTTLYPAKFFCAEGDQKVQHHLMELVCRQKRILYAGKSIQSRPSIEPNAKSFLSVPFRVMEQEAGSFNLLGLPGKSFSANQIASLENIALIVGEKLERIRLRQRAEAFSEIEHLVSWNHFLTLGKDLINKAQKNNEQLTLARISFGNIDQLENLIGLGACQELVSAIFRLLNQLIRQPAISCRLFGSQLVLLAEKSEVEGVEHRLRKLLCKLDQGTAAGRPAISQVVAHGLKINSVNLNKDGNSIEELIANLQKFGSGDYLVVEKQKAIA